MAGLDTTFIRNMAARNNYIGIAGYLGSLQFEDKTAQAQVNQLISGLNRYGRLMETIINAGTPEDRKKLAFYFKAQTGNYGATNDQSDYDRKYLANINNIGNKKGKQADYIEYTFSNQTAFNNFKDSFGSIGFANDVDRVSGLINKNGQNILRVYKSDLGKSDMFNRLNNALQSIEHISPASSGESYYDRLSEAQKNKVNFQLANFEANNRLRGIGKSELDRTKQEFARQELIRGLGFSSTSYDRDGNKLLSANGFMKEQAEAMGQSKEAEQAYKSVMDNMKNTTIPSQLMMKGYMCKGQLEIANRVMNGMMDKSIGEFGLKRIAEYYARQLMGCSLTQYDVYATDGNPKTHNLNEITNTEEKTALTEELRAALKEGRCTYSAGSAGGRVGTVITLAPALDKDGKPIGGYKEGRQIFVPGLLEKDARDAMEEDPEAAVLIKRGEHMAFGHQYDLNGGGRLVDFQQDGSAYYENGNGRVYRNSEEVGKMMLDNEMIDATKRELQNDRLERDMSDEDYNKLVEEYATKLYSYSNNIASTEDLEKLDKEGVKQGISRYVSLLLDQ